MSSRHRNDMSLAAFLAICRDVVIIVLGIILIVQAL
jgi:hypothetical protein